MSQEPILIVDSNEAFATILTEGLEQSGEYDATVAYSGTEALQSLESGEFALVIIDLGLEDPDGPALARTLRQQRPDQPLMLIPLMGEDLPAALGDLEIQGVLTKPFFFPELPGIIGSALGRGPSEPVALPPAVPEAEPDPVPIAPAVAPPPSADLPAKPEVQVTQANAERLAKVRGRISGPRMERIVQAMNGLVQDLNAESVILTCSGGLVAHAGPLPEQDANSLAQVVSDSWSTSARVAKILGQKHRSFEQSLDGGQHMLYSLGIIDDIVLSAAMSLNVPLGMVRHSAKATAESVRRLIG